MKCIAHRGGPSAGNLALPENSLAAIARALEMGVDGIEIDVFAVDGELWIAHDRVLGRTINGEGVMIDQTHDYLASLKLSNGESIPRLRDVLQLVGDKAELNIEIKGPNVVPLLARQLRDFILDYHTTFEQYVLSSFDHQQLHQALLAMPQVRRGVLVEGIPYGYAAICEPLKAFSFNTGLEFLSPELLADARKRGLENWIYTVNRPEDWALLSELPVDAIFTDRPDAFMAFRENAVNGWKS